jgi:hypothetical protein
MTNESNHANQGSPNGDGYERRDIGVGGVLYFLLGLAVAGVIANFAVSGLYSFLEKRSEAEQTSASPLISGTPADTRHLPADSKKYLDQKFPAPQLETDERGQLDSIRNNEAQALSSYGWIDQQAGTVRIPIDRAMDLIAERGLPVRKGAADESASAATAMATGTKDAPATPPAQKASKKKKGK